MAMSAVQVVTIQPGQTENEEEENEDFLREGVVLPGEESQFGHRSYCRRPNEGAPLWPPVNWAFDFMFFRLLFKRLITHGHGANNRVHITVLRTVTMRLLDAVGLNGLTNVEEGYFGRNENIETRWYTWKTLLQEVAHEGQPEVRLDLAERIWMTLERPDSSQLARAISIFMMLIITSNLSILVLASEEKTCKEIIPDFLDRVDETGRVHCGGKFQWFCMVVFTAEYVTKLVCSPFVRAKLFNSELLLELAVPPSDSLRLSAPLQHTWQQRLWAFIIAPLNLVDLASILPFWVTLLCGSIVPAKSTSALRVIRITRVARIFKAGRYLQPLQILGSVLVSSFKPICIMFGIISFVAIIGGAMLHLIEGVHATEEDPEGHFPTIPSSAFFVYAGILVMENNPIFENKVESWGGQFVWVLVHLCKGIIVILPVGPIKAAFDRADAEMKADEELKIEVSYELLRPDWSFWHGLNRSARCWIKVIEIVDKVPTGREAVEPMPMPLLESRHHAGFLDIDFPNLRRPWHQFMADYAEIKLHFEWTPSEQMLKAPAPSMPDGQLQVRLLEGTNFLGAKDAQWRVEICVPSDAVGDQRQTEFIDAKGSGPSLGFPRGATKFDVAWEMEGYGEPHMLCRQSSVMEAQTSIGGTRHIEANDFDAIFYKGMATTLDGYSKVIHEQNMRLAGLERTMLQRCRELEG